MSGSCTLSLDLGRLELAIVLGDCLSFTHWRRIWTLASCLIDRDQLYLVIINFILGVSGRRYINNIVALLGFCALQRQRLLRKYPSLLMRLTALKFRLLD